MNASDVAATVGPSLLVYLWPRVYLWRRGGQRVPLSDVVRKNPDVELFKRRYVGGHVAVVVVGTLSIVILGQWSSGRPLADQPDARSIGLIVGLILFSLAFLTGWCARRFGVYPMSMVSHGQLLVAHRPHDRTIHQVGTWQVVVSLVGLLAAAAGLVVDFA
jgi:hypothetical protein